MQPHLRAQLVERDNDACRTILVIADDGMGSRYSAAVALYVAHYNFCRVHETLQTTPANRARYHRSYVDDRRTDRRRIRGRACESYADCAGPVQGLLEGLISQRYVCRATARNLSE